ncbi:tRNA pseudouridine(13) synthase TruD [Deinococcus yavapaiensis]|uniref:tRNA pseudouridine synthase D n=1 Tax=Deinococcus yavapaiensis KR-236 TaxID=694435 RepID=A0A318SCX5_9DEIO|nr:tRNA pseudouridine(13) synthase TruD [Deinococcus yavapaiensis]PYE54741.1 TruD family tRNA pseudouridine synthase [Deinococcus yavapaiensis KR-236]
MSFSFDWSTLTPLTRTLGTGGVLRTEPDDFVVEEVPLYTPSGEGEHVYVRLRKTGHTTAFVAKEIARQLDVKLERIGIAGLKDRHAVTTQWLSLPDKAERRLERFSMEGVDVLEVARHGNKLGIGHLRGNRFTVRVRGARGEETVATAILDELVRRGVPNYFGPQRFGLGGLNAEEGLRVLRGESRTRDPRVRRFLVSSVQSVLFNAWLSARMERGWFDAVLRGDMAKKHDTGGVFRVEDAAAESERAARGEISATGTLFGRKVKPLTDEAGDLEREILDRFGLTPEVFASRRGDRRLSRVFLEDARVASAEDGFTVSFFLPRGSFATSVLREVMKVDVDVAGGANEDDAHGEDDVE